MDELSHKLLYIHKNNGTNKFNSQDIKQVVHGWCINSLDNEKFNDFLKLVQ